MSMIEVVYGEVDPRDVVGKRGYAYECPYPVEIGGTVEVPGTGGGGFPQLATVVSLSSDYNGEAQMVMRTMPSRVVQKRLKEALMEIHGWLADVETSSLTVDDVATRVRTIASEALWPGGREQLVERVSESTGVPVAVLNGSTVKCPECGGMGGIPDAHGEVVVARKPGSGLNFRVRTCGNCDGTGTVLAPGVPVTTTTGELGELVDVSAPPRAVCSACGRKTWADGQACLMTQPDGSTCPGTFVPVDEEPW